MIQNDLLLGPLNAGTYTVEIKDANGCTVIETYEIQECAVANTTDEIDLQLEVTQIGGNPGLPGGAAVRTDGFTPPLTVSWTGPGGFSDYDASFTTTVPGFYRATVQDACGNTSSATARIGDCEGYIGAEIQDQCIRGFNFTRSWFQIGDLNTNHGVLNHGETAQAQISFTPAASGIPQLLFDGAVSVFQNSSSRYGFSHIGNKYYIAEPGTVVITITTQAGCVFQRTIGFGLDTEIFNAYVESINSGYVTDNPSLLIQNEFTSEEFFITGFYGCKTCDSQDAVDGWTSNGTGRLCGSNAQFYIFDYEPNDRSRPCTGGGMLTYDMGGTQTIDVPENMLSQSFQAGNDCACLFPFGVISTSAQLLQLQPNFNYEYGPRPVYVEFSCVDKEDEEAGVEIEVADPELAELCIKYGCPDGDCRAKVSEDGCSYDLVCNEDGTVLISGIYSVDPSAGMPEPDKLCYYVDEGENPEDPPLLVVGIPCVTDRCNLDGFLNIATYTMLEFDYVSSTYRDCGIGSCIASPQERIAFSKRIRSEVTEEEWGIIRSKQIEPILKVFPNPLAESGLRPFTLVSNRRLSKILLYDTGGREVKIDLNTEGGYLFTIRAQSPLPGGLYVVRALTDTGEILTHKLIVN